MGSFDLSWFDSPEDAAQLERLHGLIQGAAKGTPTRQDLDALLSVFERFPGHDGFGVFWSILHYIEGVEGYGPAVIASVLRAPGEFNLSMINRMLNGGIVSVGDASLIGILEAVAASDKASDEARETARHLIAYQRAKA